MHYDNPPLYHTHFMEVPGLTDLFTVNPSKSANIASECYNGVIFFFATQSFRISVDSKRSD